MYNTKPTHHFKFCYLKAEMDITIINNYDYYGNSQGSVSGDSSPACKK